MQERWRRVRRLRAFDAGEDLVLIGRDGGIRRIYGESSAFAREVLQLVAYPRTVEEIHEHLCALSGAAFLPAEVMESLFSLFDQTGSWRLWKAETLVNDAQEQLATMKESMLSPPLLPDFPERKRVVLGVTGAAAAMHTPGLVMALQKRGCDVRIVATESALQFFRSEAVEVLTHHPVLSSMWSTPTDLYAPHIQYAEWAELVLIYPTTATTLSRIAQGDCSSLISAIAIATRAPVLLAPSMNAAMYCAPSVQRNLALLREDGFFLAHPTMGQEVAEPPNLRIPVLGAAPAHREILDILHAMWAMTSNPPGYTIEREVEIPHPTYTEPHPSHLRGLPSVEENLPAVTPAIHSQQAGLEGELEVKHMHDLIEKSAESPRSALDWEEVYASTPVEQMSWASDFADRDVMAALLQVPAPARLLDIGTGLGTIAVAAARRGYTVVATEIAPTALRHAQHTAAALPIIWLQDDITQSRLMGNFELIIDRGCFHLFSDIQADDYIETVSRLASPGAIFVLKVHHPDEARDWGTRRYSQESLEERFGDTFDLILAQESVFAGRIEPHPKALLCVFQRKGGPKDLDSSHDPEESGRSAESSFQQLDFDSL